MRLLRPLRDVPIALLWGGLATSAVGDQLYAVVLSWIAVAAFGAAAGYLTALQAAIVLLTGMRVEPGDTEAVLRGPSGVMDAAVLVHGDASAPILVAFVVPTAGEHATQPSAQTATQLARGWRATLAALLPPQQMPAHIRVVPAIPLLPSLKPDLGALRALLATENASGVLGRVWTRLRGSGPRASSTQADPPTRHSDVPP